MATLKHLGSKNADYGAAEQYLLFEHDEFTMKPVLDENGRLIPREDYRLSTLNCGGEDFAVACMRSNLRYEKNQRREDVKSHHYIISFDPRDGPDNGLTVDRAQALGEQFCKEHFPGHQALVCTHPDGHNHSGNIHVHIVINSLRIEEVPFLPYMDRPADTKAGCKHRCTDAALRYFKSEVMEMCHREGLYQIDLLNGSKNRVTDREYWAQKKGQAALDKQNAPMIAGGITPRQTKFETNMQITAIEPEKMPLLSGEKIQGQHKIEGIGDDFIPKLVDLKNIDGIIKINDDDAVNMSRRLAKELGMGVGISSGANFIGSVLLGEETKNIVVTVFADDNKKYLSTELFKPIDEDKEFISNKIELISYENI